MKSLAAASDRAPREWPGLIGRVLTPERRRFIKFAIVGGSGVLVNLATVWLAARLLFAGMGDRDMAGRLTLLSGIVVSIFTNFVINDTWTWGDRSKDGAFAGWLRRCRDFYIAASVAGLVQWLVSLGMREVVVLDGGWLGLDAEALALQLAALTGIAVATPINYVVNHFWTFRAS